LGRSGK